MLPVGAERSAFPLASSVTCLGLGGVNTLLGSKGFSLCKVNKNGGMKNARGSVEIQLPVFWNLLSKFAGHVLPTSPFTDNLLLLQVQDVAEVTG